MGLNIMLQNRDKGELLLIIHIGFPSEHPVYVYSEEERYVYGNHNETRADGPEAIHPGERNNGLSEHCRPRRSASGADNLRVEDGAISAFSKRDLDSRRGRIPAPRGGDNGKSKRGASRRLRAFHGRRSPRRCHRTRLRASHVSTIYTSASA